MFRERIFAHYNSLEFPETQNLLALNNNDLLSLLESRFHNIDVGLDRFIKSSELLNLRLFTHVKFEGAIKLIFDVVLFD